MQHVYGDNNLNEGVFRSGEQGLLSGIQMRNDIQQRYEERNLKFKGFNLVNVPASTLNGLLVALKEKPEIDLVSIDVEGHDMGVFNVILIS